MKIGRTTDEVTQAAELVKEQASSSKQPEPVEFIDTGSAALNCALSGKAKGGGWARGRIINVVGDGSSGKTLLAMEFIARCLKLLKKIKSHIYPEVKRIRVVYDNGESVMDFDLDSLFWDGFREEIIWYHSETVEDFGRTFTREVQAHKEGTALVYILDSMDSLGSDEGMERFEKAARLDRPEDGAYNTEKPKYLSNSFFDNICSMMRGKDITLMIISQIRENIGISFGKKYKRCGGKALDFYTHQVCWLYVEEKMKKEYQSEKRAYGIRVRAVIERNKTWKPYREAEFLIIFDYGLDDIGSNLLYLYGPKRDKLDWDGEEFDRAGLIKYIEKNKLQSELRDKVEKKWCAVEEAIKPSRQQRDFDEVCN